MVAASDPEIRMADGEGAGRYINGVTPTPLPTGLLQGSRFMRAFHR
jgi:hypothetical protein